MNPDKLPDAPSFEGEVLPKNKNNFNSTFTRKKVARFIGGTVLAIAVAFGGGTALSQVPLTVVQGAGVVSAPAPADQSTQNTDSAAPIATNAAALPANSSDTAVNSNASPGNATIPGSGSARNGTGPAQVRGRNGGGR